MHNPSLIFLVGFMGSGKSYYGKKIANALQYNWVDLDKYIEHQSDMPIKSIFKLWGEEQFRKIERDCLHQMMDRNKTVVSCGGGTPCFFDNMDLMNQKGITVFINTPLEFIIGRLRNNKSKRPTIMNLNDDELKIFVEKQMNNRLPFYELSKFKFNQKENWISFIESLKI